MVTDPIADMITIIRNGYLAKLKSVKIPKSKMKASIAQVLKDEAFISDFEEKDKDLVVKLRYVSTADSLSKKAAMTNIQRVSSPGLRVYKGSGNVPKVMGGLGVTIVSTSKGIMTSQEAKKRNLGGELICKVW